MGDSANGSSRSAAVFSRGSIISDESFEFSILGEIVGESESVLLATEAPGMAFSSAAVSRRKQRIVGDRRNGLKGVEAASNGDHHQVDNLSVKMLSLIRI